MRKFNQRGFSPVETTLVLVIVGLVAFVAWYVFHTKSDTDTTLGNAANTQTEVSSGNSTKPTPSKTSTAAAVVVTKTDSKGTKYLADPAGKTLYTYDQDTDNKSNCTGSCLSTWPAYKATSSSASLPTNVGTITRSDDGSLQYTYKKMPLYYFASDTSAGQVTGNGVNGFSQATP
jgi:predicted lipoprotein with Yx(FWY)xxD motif